MEHKENILLERYSPIFPDTELHVSQLFGEKHSFMEMSLAVGAMKFYFTGKKFFDPEKENPIHRKDWAHFEKFLKNAKTHIGYVNKNSRKNKPQLESFSDLFENELLHPDVKSDFEQYTIEEQNSLRDFIRKLDKEWWDKL